MCFFVFGVVVEVEVEVCRGGHEAGGLCFIFWRGVWVGVGWCRSYTPMHIYIQYTIYIPPITHLVPNRRRRMEQEAGGLFGLV